jgi:hypothetical protein
MICWHDISAYRKLIIECGGFWTYNYSIMVFRAAGAVIPAERGGKWDYLIN